MRYIDLGDRLTDAALKGRGCDPVRRSDGKCAFGRSKQLVEFDEGKHVVVLRRRLRVHARLSQGRSNARE
jgi:hypothetical protein